MAEENEEVMNWTIKNCVVVRETGLINIKKDKQKICIKKCFKNKFKKKLLVKRRIHQPV